MANPEVDPEFFANRFGGAGVDIIDDEYIESCIDECGVVPPFSYSVSELERLGTGSMVDGIDRVKYEIEFGTKTVGEMMMEGRRPLQDELDILPPLFPVQKPRRN